MKSVWDAIFSPEAAEKPLTDRENEKALRELAIASGHVEKLQVSPEHERIAGLIREKLRQRSLHDSGPKIEKSSGLA